MRYKEEAELATRIVITAIQSGKIDVGAENVASYYATIFTQIVGSCMEQARIDDAARSQF